LLIFVGEIAMCVKRKRVAEREQSMEERGAKHSLSPVVLYLTTTYNPFGYPVVV